MHAKADSPVGAPKPSHPGPGRPPGSKNRQPATRHDASEVLATGEAFSRLTHHKVGALGRIGPVSSGSVRLWWAWLPIAGAARWNRPVPPRRLRDAPGPSRVPRGRGRSGDGAVSLAFACGDDQVGFNPLHGLAGRTAPEDGAQHVLGEPASRRTDYGPALPREGTCGRWTAGSLTPRAGADLGAGAPRPSWRAVPARRGGGPWRCPRACHSAST